MKLFILCIVPVLVLAESLRKNNVQKGLQSGCNLAEDGQFPYQVAIFNKNNFICSGSLIAPNWVLTSAQCVNCVLSNNVFVLAGSTDLDEMGDPERVISVIKHECYNPKGAANNIALLELKNPINTTDKIQVIPLDETRVETVNATFASWTRNDHVCDQLVYSNVTIDTQEDCEQALNYWITYDQLCVLYGSNHVGCTDNGSPLVSDGKQVGILSHVCKSRKNAAVYTRVSSYIDWIANRTGVGKD